MYRVYQVTDEIQLQFGKVMKYAVELCCLQAVKKTRRPDIGSNYYEEGIIYPRRSRIAGRAFEMKSLVVMT